MRDWFEFAPDWCQVVVYWGSMGWVIYLETDKQSKSGRVLIAKNPDNPAKLSDYGTTGSCHVWHSHENQRQVVARRSATELRTLNQEEVAILSDLGLLEMALEMQGAIVEEEVPDETFLQINVWNDEDDIVYSFDEHKEDDSAVTVDEFFDVVEKVYNKLGFQNLVTISTDYGTTGFTKVIGG